MTRFYIFRLYFAIRRQHMGVIKAARLALREALTPMPF